ncbi:glucokinase [Solimicrobium silvestre]|uniref:Glucokinase n=1 Tax=Solimicrobium silvestre TaxID=2099400 RepID=A0A2S9H5C5_9BURK|nr:glucokinase [Solimicrobium silvestre]PRC95182.1 glk: glucokinase [Solimicrobium silvestre]
MTYPHLLADIGGTNARFAVETAPGKLEAILILPCANYATLSDAIKSYLATPLAIEAGASQVRKVGIAIANPVHGDLIQMTNHHWSFSIQSVKNEFNFSTLLVINDFKALAMALPFLDQTQKYQVGAGRAQEGGVIGLLGAGTGLGVSGLIPSKSGWVALDSEGGHTSFAPTNAREIAILQFALQTYKHVSSERLMSGAGLQLIYRALADLHKVTADDIDPPEIMRRGLENECPICSEVLTTFCELLGTMASNLAITLGSKGGIYIGGGIVPRLGSYFNQSHFRQRFEQKGRFANYLEQIPTFVITEPYPAFIGISAMLGQISQE